MLRNNIYNNIIIFIMPLLILTTYVCIIELPAISASNVGFKLNKNYALLAQFQAHENFIKSKMFIF